ncbi:MAG: hypothetical protein ABGX33_08000 [Cycloclasticus sp.]
MDKKSIIAVVGYGLSGALFAVFTAYYFLYNSEVYVNERFVESFNQPIIAAQDNPKQLAALKALQAKGFEWAQYQFVGAIQEQNTEIVGLYVDAGMALKNRSVIIGQMIENPSNWTALIKRLGWDNQQRLSGLFEVPRHLDALDPYFKKTQARYAIPHDVAFKDFYLEFKVIHDKWLDEKNVEIAGVHDMCDGKTRCIAVNVPVIHTEYEKKRPIAPKKDFILWQEPHLSLMSAAIFLGNQDAIRFLNAQGVTSRLNKMVMSDRIVVVFEVAEDTTISYPVGVTVKNLHR